MAVLDNPLTGATAEGKKTLGVDNPTERAALSQDEGKKVKRQILLLGIAMIAVLGLFYFGVGHRRVVAEESEVNLVREETLTNPKYASNLMYADGEPYDGKYASCFANEKACKSKSFLGSTKSLLQDIFCHKRSTKAFCKF